MRLESPSDLIQGARRHEAVRRNFNVQEYQPTGGRVKRVVDLFICLFAVLLLLPLLAGLALLIKMDGGGPIFYGHRRVGYRGRHFRCWKFRTMVVNGDAVLQKYLADNPEERSIWFTQRKLRNDPRVTPLGRVLRKLSLDELPQIINVLIGEMSFVGPRPIVDAELAMYRSSAGHYLRNRPGITGLWQVSGRSDTSFTRRIALDRLYSQRWTVLADLRVLVWTIPAVVFAKGAH